MLNVEVHPDVYAELEESRVWYANISTILSEDLLNEVEIAMSKVKETPLSWSPYMRGTRRYFVHRFPFAVIYRIESDRIRIYAVSHFKRKPGYWLSRNF